MQKQEVIDAIKKVKENSQKRNFNQSIDLIINLKGLDFKKADNQIDLFVSLHFARKNISICALIGPELEKQAKETFNEVILADDFVKYKDKKEIKKLANKHNFFVAQATVMPKIATTFGRVLGPRGKMPNPKIGSVVPPNANLKPLRENLQKTIRLMTRNNPIIQCSVGKEDSDENEIIDNALTIYNSVLGAVPNEKQNIRNVFLKLTMGKAVQVGKKADKNVGEEETVKEKKVKKDDKKASKEKTDEKVVEKKEGKHKKGARKEKVKEKSKEKKE